MRIKIIFIFSLFIILKVYGQTHTYVYPCLYLEEKEDSKRFKIEQDKRVKSEYYLLLKYQNTLREKIDTVNRSYLWAIDPVPKGDSVINTMNISNKRKIERPSKKTLCDCQRINKFSTGGKRFFKLIVKTNQGYFKYDGRDSIVDE